MKKEEGKSRYGYRGGERERTWRFLNLDYYDETRKSGEYGMPRIPACVVDPPKFFIPYNKAARVHRNHIKGHENWGIHFFIDDYFFENLWRTPRLIMPMLTNFRCVCTPNFSIWDGMPKAMVIWQAYRTRMLGQMLADAGCKVIPTLCWAEEDSYEYCIDGLPKHSDIIVSSVGISRDAYYNTENRKEFVKGMNYIIKSLHPAKIYRYGKKLEVEKDINYGDIFVKYYSGHKWGKQEWE